MKRRQKGTGTIVKTGNWYYGRIVRNGSVRVVKLSKNAREAGFFCELLERTNHGSASRGP